MTDIKILNSNMLKFVAIIAMTIDHIAWTVYPGYPRDILPLIMHIIGRITCPIMCYFVAEGYYHTKNINRYTARLFIFSLISHFAYIFYMSGSFEIETYIPFRYGNLLNQTSVIWSLAWGLIMLRVANSSVIKHNWQKIGLILLICVVSFPSDWSCIASLCVLAFGLNRGKLKKQMFWLVFYVFLYSVVYFFVFSRVYAVVQLCVILCAPLLMLYNGERGKNQKINKFMKWFFYIYYPLHMLIIGVMKFML